MAEPGGPGRRGACVRPRPFPARWGPVCLVLAVLLGVLGCDQAPEERQDAAKAREAFASGYFLGAEKAWEDYIRTYPQGRFRLEGWNRLVDLAELRGDAGKSADLLEAMLLEYEQDPEVRLAATLRLADLYQRQDRGDLALDLWRGVLDLRDLPAGKRAEVLRLMARAARGRGEAEASLDFLRQCAQAAPGPEPKALCLYDLAQGLNLDQRVREAMQAAEEVRGLSGASEPVRTKATFLLAEIHEFDRNIKKARELYETIAGLYPNREVVEYRLKHLGRDGAGK